MVCEVRSTSATRKRETLVIQLHDDHIGGPFTFFNPTRAHFKHVALPGKKALSNTASQEEKAEPIKDELLA